MVQNEMSKKIKKAILKKGIISFDIFDTLIYRNCLHPSDIFQFVEKRYNEISNKKISDFTSKRRNAAILAKKKYDVEEATYDQIYDCFSDKYDVELLKQLEKEVEFDFCVANNDVKPLYDYAKENNKRIVCVSDMYYDSNTLRKLLKKCGYDIKEIYVSSEYNKKKNTRKLFKELLRLGEFKSTDIIHIGDAEKGDFLFPKLLGIKTILVKKDKNNIYLSNKNIDLTVLDNTLIYSVSNNNLEKDKYYRFGHEVIGPVCLYYLLWLNKQCSNNNYKMLFCARDMKMLYDMYNILFPLEKDRTEYFYVSRRSLRLPYLYKNNSYDSIINTIANHKLTIIDILDNFNLMTDAVMKRIKKEDIVNKIYNKKDISSKHNDLYDIYESILKHEIDNTGKVEYEYFVNYFKKIQSEGFYLIDMGWKGTTQKMLMNLFPKHKIKGLYFGVEEQDKYDEINEKTSSGYLFFKNSEFIDDIQTKIYSSEVLFEKIFAAQHQSTIKYQDKNPYYVFDNKKIQEDKNITVLQSGAIDFIKSVKNYIKYLQNESNLVYINILMNNLISPNLSFAKVFGEITNDNMYNRKMASPKSLFYYLFHPRKLKVDIGKSGWKIGFMKRLFKIKLPYWNIYKKAYEIKKRGE